MQQKIVISDAGLVFLGQSDDIFGSGEWVHTIHICVK